MLLDFLTETCEFSKTAPPELKRQVMEELRKPECSQERDGKVLFNNNLSVIVIEPWVNLFLLPDLKQIVKYKLLTAEIHFSYFRNGLVYFSIDTLLFEPVKKSVLISVVMSEL